MIKMLNEKEEFVFLHIQFANQWHLLHHMDIINAIYVKLHHSHNGEAV